ncbi:MAG: superoxide dismutase [Patescibacteria group bacterium]
MTHSLPKLLYAYDDLEPYIDARTMEIHHTKHHQAYVDKLNAALEGYPDLQKKSLEELLQSIEAVPGAIRVAVKNHGGGHFNHSMFWKMMKPPARPGNGGGEPRGEVGKIITSKFGEFLKFKEEFTKAATGFFGSGWVWLVLKDESFEIITTPNQESPIMQGFNPVLGLDVWEHAYYLKYQNKRPDYINAWWNVVNWDEVGNNLNKVNGK